MPDGVAHVVLAMMAAPSAEAAAHAESHGVVPPFTVYFEK